MGVIMNKKIVLLVTTIVLLSFSVQSSQGEIDPGKIYVENLLAEYRNVTVYAPAVAQSGSKLVGVISTITVTIQSNGSGRVFVDTLPLAQIDMQGSARLAVKVASALVINDKNCSVNPYNYDYFFVVRTDAPIIGGPSAGATMAIATISLLENWDIDNKTVMTGMINPDGSIGPIGGIKQKIDAAHDYVGADRFLVPKGQGTYIDYTQEESNSGNVVVKSIKPVKKSYQEYADEKKYGMDVVEVADVKEAIRNFTEYRFESDVTPVEIDTGEYLQTLEPLASSLINKSTDLYQRASDLFNTSKSSIPDREYEWDSFRWVYYERDLENSLYDSDAKIEEGREWYEKNKYYTSVTKSFLSLISSRTVYYSCNYFNTKESDRKEYAKNIIEEVDQILENKSNLARNREIKGMASLQFIGAAQKRVSEANDYLSIAEEKYDQGKYYESIQYLAYAYERCRSVGWWLNLSTKFNETNEIKTEEIDKLALDYIEDAQQAITYSVILLEETNERSKFLSNAEELLQSARDERENGYPASALFKALEAITRANLDIETIGIDDQSEYLDKIERLNQSSLTRLSSSINQGIKPVLAVCYYEYGESLLKEDDLANSLFYLRFSSMIAGALHFANMSEGATSSRFIGVTNLEKTNQNVFRFTYPEIMNIVYKYGGVGFIFGLCVGFGLALIIWGISSKRKKEKFHETWVPRSIQDYSKKQHKEKHYGENEMPRSIQDFYKKNK